MEQYIRNTSVNGVRLYGSLGFNQMLYDFGLEPMKYDDMEAVQRLVSDSIKVFSQLFYMDKISLLMRKYVSEHSTDRHIMSSYGGTYCTLTIQYVVITMLSLLLLPSNMLPLLCFHYYSYNPICCHYYCYYPICCHYYCYYPICCHYYSYHPICCHYYCYYPICCHYYCYYPICCHYYYYYPICCQYHCYYISNMLSNLCLLIRYEKPTTCSTS